MTVKAMEADTKDLCARSYSFVLGYFLISIVFFIYFVKSQVISAVEKKVSLDLQTN